MENDTVSWLWAVATIAGPVLLAVALAYGVAKTKPWKRGAAPRGPVPPEQRTINAASWGAEDHLGARPQPDTDPRGAARAARPETQKQQAQKQQAQKQQAQKQQADQQLDAVIQLDDRSRS